MLQPPFALKLTYRLPSVIEQINNKYTAISRELEALGSEPGSEPVRDMLNLVTKFVKIIEDQTAGDRDKTLIQALNSQYEMYKDHIWLTRPYFLPLTRAEIRKKEKEDEDLPWDAFLEMPELAEGADEDVEDMYGDVITLDTVRNQIDQ